MCWDEQTTWQSLFLDSVVPVWLYPIQLGLRRAFTVSVN